MKTNIKEVYVRIFGEDIFPHIEKAIDENGWYCSEKNDQWLPLQPYQLPKLNNSKNGGHLLTVFYVFHNITYNL